MPTYSRRRIAPRKPHNYMLALRPFEVKLLRRRRRLDDENLGLGWAVCGCHPLGSVARSHSRKPLAVSRNCPRRYEVECLPYGAVYGVWWCPPVALAAGSAGGHAAAGGRERTLISATRYCAADHLDCGLGRIQGAAPSGGSVSRQDRQDDLQLGLRDRNCQRSSVADPGMVPEVSPADGVLEGSGARGTIR